MYICRYVLLELLLDPLDWSLAKESEGDKSEKLDSCVTGMATSHDGEGDENDELGSYDSWRRLSE